MLELSLTYAWCAVCTSPAAVCNLEERGAGGARAAHACNVLSRRLSCPLTGLRDNWLSTWDAFTLIAICKHGVGQDRLHPLYACLVGSTPAVCFHKRHNPLAWTHMFGPAYGACSCSVVGEAATVLTRRPVECCTRGTLTQGE
jgi:hypothetical protein